MQFDDFLGVLTLLKDTSSFEAKVQELITREKAINSAIDSLNLGKDISNAVDLANKKVADGKLAVEKSKLQAEQIVADARKVYDSKFAQLQEHQVKADQAIADLNGYKSGYAAKEDALNKTIKENTALQKQLKAEKEAVSILQADLEARLAKLRQVMG